MKETNLGSRDHMLQNHMISEHTYWWRCSCIHPDTSDIFIPSHSSATYWLLDLYVSNDIGPLGECEGYTRSCCYYYCKTLFMRLIL